MLRGMELSLASLASPLASLSLLGPLLLGAVLGGIGGLLGIGGGIIAIPVLAMGFGMEQQLAQGTALVMITPNVLIAFWRYISPNPNAQTAGLAFPAFVFVGADPLQKTFAVRAD